MTVTVGVAPGGVGARLHYRVLAERPYVSVRQVRLPRIEHDQDATPCSWRDVLRRVEDFGLFVVGTPPHCHLDHAEHLIRAGVLVLCEKPAGMNAGQARRIAAVASGAGVDCRVNYQLRFDPLMQTARGMISQERPDSVEITCTSGARMTRSGKPAWYWQPDAGGGVWFSLLSHLIDLAHYLGLTITEPEVTRAVPGTGPMHGIDAITIQARPLKGGRLTLTADALGGNSTLTVSLRGAAGATGFDLIRGTVNRSGEPAAACDPRPAGPWHAAFGHCADDVLSPHQINLAQCATLQDAVNVHLAVEAIRTQL